ncbi:MAG: hypothetical protein OQK01_11035 [Xanthomonadales bacterium]|nr:hypothetical protein [Xanthomonadales bacterium]
MRSARVESWKSLHKLLKFLFWYGIAVTAVLYLLPMAAVAVEDRYAAMSSTARLFSVIGFFVVIGAWQVMSMRDRMKRLRPGRRESRVDGA